MMQLRAIAILKVLVIAALNLFMIAFVAYAASVYFADFLPAGETAAALSRRGSRGEEVELIQQTLRDWGYFDGTVDGIYGAATEAAVRDFQRQNGLTADGVAGTQTLLALGITSSPGNLDSQPADAESDYHLLARIISAEARGEPYIGQVAVGAVVLNRVEHPSFPDTIAGVIFQPGAFTAVVDGQYDEPVAESCYRAASEALAGQDPTGGALYYYNPDKTTNAWMLSRPVMVEIGNHLVCN